MAQPSRAIIVAGNYRCGTTWLAEMLTRALPKHALLFEPIRQHYPTMGTAVGDLWRPYITAENSAGATLLERTFRSVFDGTFVNANTVAHTDKEAVLAADALVVKMVRGLCSLRWMADTFKPRHTFVVMRHPCMAIASQFRVGAVPGTPKQRWQLDSFFDHHPEIQPFLPKTDAAWFAIYWAMGYYVALSTPRPHPWTLLKYEELVGNPEQVQASVFGELGEFPEGLEELVKRPSFQTKRPTPGNHVWVPGTSPLSTQQASEVWGVIERFPGLEEHYAP